VNGTLHEFFKQRAFFAVLASPRNSEFLIAVFPSIVNYVRTASSIGSSTLITTNAENGTHR
jgi:hypothetical protein